jgi:hypothetical protein
VTYTGLQVNVTDSGPSNAASLLMDLRVGGVSRFRVDKDGQFNTGGSTQFSKVNALTASTQGFLAIGQIGTASAESAVGISFAGLKVRSDKYLGFNSTNNLNNSPDLTLFRDGASGTLAQRNGTAAQESRIYGTYSGAGDYRRLALKMSNAGVAQIVAEGAGSGAAGNVLQLPANTTFADAPATRTELGLGTGNSPTFAGAVFAGHVTMSAANTYDIGGLLGTKPRDICADRILQVAGAGSIRFEGRGRLTCDSFNKITVINPSSVLVDFGAANLTASGTIQTGGYTFANLPTSPTTGMRAYITDGAAIPVYMANAAGGGSTVTPVFYNGSNWINA